MKKEKTTIPTPVNTNHPIPEKLKQYKATPKINVKIPINRTINCRVSCVIVFVDFITLLVEASPVIPQRTKLER